MSGSQDQARLRVAVTGATGDLASLLLPLLEQDERVERVLAIDTSKPPAHGPKVDFHPIELSQQGSETLLAEALTKTGIDVVCHLAFIHGRVHSPSFAHELEVIGSMQVLSATWRARARRLIVPSLTALYGARPHHPAFLKEDTPLLGSPGSRFLNDRVEVEQQLQAFRKSHPELEILVLRFAPIVGPTVNNPMTRWLKTRLVPTLLGFDPLWQVIHEEDAARALQHALFAKAQGAFNVAAPGVLSLSGLVRQSGGAVVPLPHAAARAAIHALEMSGVAAVPEPLLDFIHYNLVADSRRSREELGFVPSYDARDAAASLRGV